MRALKGLMKYVGIVLLACILIIAFTIGVMYFVPSVSILGYYFRQSIQGNIEIFNSISLTENNLTGNTINLTIEAGNYHIKVVPHQVDMIKVKANNNFIGLVKATEVNKDNIGRFNIEKLDGTETDNPNYVEGVKVGQKLCVVNPYITYSTLNDSNPKAGEFNFVVHEPEGILSRNASNVIVFYVPARLNNAEIKYNIDIKTNNGDVRLNNSIVAGTDNTEEDLLYVNSINIETNKGSGEFKGIKSLSNDRNILTLNALNISTNGGTFDFTNFNEVRVNKPIELESKKAKYIFKTLKSYYDNGNTTDEIMNGAITISGTNVEFTADAVYCGIDGFSYKSSTGLLKINKLMTGYVPKEVTDKYIQNTDENGNVTYTKVDGKTEFYIAKATPYENTIFTKSAVVELQFVLGKLGLQDEMGEVTINHLCHQATIRTENSNIKIGTTGFLPDERTTETKLQAGVAKENLSDKNFTSTSSLILYSTYGDITVGEYYQDAVIYSKKGHITAYSKYSGIKDGEANVQYDKGSIATAYWGRAGEQEQERTGWWGTPVKNDKGETISYSNPITADYITFQLGKGSPGEEKGYYSSTDHVGVAYYNSRDGKWYSNKVDSTYSNEITDTYIKNQLEGKNSDTYYFKIVDDSSVRYYYSDISTKDGEVNITTDKNPVKVIASDKATINLTILGVMETSAEYPITNDTETTEDDTIARANLNPFGTDDYMYIAETKNGKVNATLPITSYIVQVNCKKIEGSIGATSELGEYDKTTKSRPEVQINAAKNYQPKIRLTGKTAVLDSDI